MSQRPIKDEEIIPEDVEITCIDDQEAESVRLCKHCGSIIEEKRG